VSLLKSAQKTETFPLSAFTYPKPADKLNLLQPQELILGLFGEYVSVGEKVWSGGLVRLMQELDFSIAASRVGLNRVVGRNLLQTERLGRFVYYLISPKLEAVLNVARQRTYSIAVDESWDGNWTLVWYSIPDAMRPQRGRLGRSMSFRGFGSLQDGTWIAPGNRATELRPLLKQIKLEPYVYTFVASLGEQTEVRSIVDKVWNIEKLDRRYSMLAREFGAYVSERRYSKLSPREAFIVRTRAIEMFRQTTAQDPRLPDKLLKIRWKRREALENFDKLHRGLAPAATAYFREIAIRE
jgi:phenylacetic acid degradation operon negative regulatory protein